MSIPKSTLFTDPYTQYCLENQGKRISVLIYNDDKVIKELKSLATRAADALDMIDEEWALEELGLDLSLIKELRDAAK